MGEQERIKPSDLTSDEWDRVMLALSEMAIKHEGKLEQLDWDRLFTKASGKWLEAKLIECRKTVVPF